MHKSNLIFILLISVGFVYGQYHPEPLARELTELQRIADKAFYKSGLENYDNTLVVYQGNLGCNESYDIQEPTQLLFESGIEFLYVEKRKCLLKKKDILFADVYYFDKNNVFLGYFDGHVFVNAVGSDGSSIYPRKERFLNYLLENNYTDIFNLNCSLGITMYYALNESGEPLLIDEANFTLNKEPARKIADLN